MLDPTNPDAACAGERLAPLRAMIEQAGFRVEEATDGLVAFMAPSGGCAVSLQIGDCIAVKDDGATCLTIRCGLHIRAADDRLAGLTRWRIRKVFHRRIAFEQLEFAFEADLTLPDAVSLARFLSRGGEVDRHLRSLIADARATLSDRSIANARANDAVHPVLRIEAKFLGDLAIGRSGFVASGGSRLSAPKLKNIAAACEWLSDIMLPDLARATGIAMRQVSPSLACEPSIVPDLEPVT